MIKPQDLLKMNSRVVVVSQTSQDFHISFPNLVSASVFHQVKNLDETFPITTKSHDIQLQSSHLSGEYLFGTSNENIFKTKPKTKKDNKTMMNGSQNTMAFPIDGRSRILIPSVLSLLNDSTITAVAAWIVKFRPFRSM